MSKVKISEVAEEAAKSSKQVLEACEKMKISAKAAGSSISESDAERLMDFLINGVAATPAPKKPAVKKAEPVKTEEKSTPSKYIDIKDFYILLKKCNKTDKEIKNIIFQKVFY